VNLDDSFLIVGAPFSPIYTICDPESLDKLSSDKPGEVKTKTANGEDVILKGIEIDPATNQLRLHNITVDPATIQYPANIRLSVRARTQDTVT